MASVQDVKLRPTAAAVLPKGDAEALMVHHAAANAPSCAPTASAAPKRQPIAPALLDDEQAAELLGVSRRKFHELRDEPWWTVRAVVLGPRLMRWHRAELEAAIDAMPRERAKGSEPAQLARARIERMKRGAAA